MVHITNALNADIGTMHVDVGERPYPSSGCLNIGVLIALSQNEKQLQFGH